MKTASALLLAQVAASASARAPQDATPSVVRAAALVGAMTLDEKLSLLDGDVVLDGNGTGLNRCVGHVPAIPRLGIPALCMGDGPAGVGNGLRDVTQFPAPMMVAAAFDTGLAEAFGQALGAEHAGKGRNVVLAPTINIARTPLWGRDGETMSEDPFLTAALAAPLVRGIQSNGVIATPKHYLANNQEWLRLGLPPAYAAVDARVSERALREVYMPGFRAAVTQGGAGSLMCAYNRVNTRYACENETLLAIPQRDWGFNGFVVADWYFAHRSTVDAAMNGLDISMPGGKSPFGFPDYYGAPLRQAVASGTVPLARIDTLARHVVEPMIRLGMIGHPEQGDPAANVRTEAHSALARRIVEEGTVLLRNEAHVLPLDAQRSIAVIGDDGGPHVQTTERYGGFVGDDGITKQSPLDAIKARAGGAVRVVYAPGTTGLSALPAIPADRLRAPDGGAGLRATYYATPDLSGPAALTRNEAQVDAANARPDGLPELWSARWEGSLTPQATGLHRFSVSAGGGVDLYVDGTRVIDAQQDFRSTFHGTASLVAGKPVAIRLDYRRGPPISAPEVRLGWEAPNPARLAAAVEAARKSDVAIVFVSDSVSEGSDRTTLALPGDQDQLIDAVAAVNPRTIVVLHTVGPVLMPWRDKVAGVVMGWYAGEQASPALAALLFGDVDPSGRLPITFPAHDGDHPSSRPDRSDPSDPVVRYDEGLAVGYRWFDGKGIKPLYPFGFGLSYTAFSISAPTVKPLDRDHWTVTAVVRNTGARAGVAVPQLYAGFPAVAQEPPQLLRGFARVSLAPGESKPVSFTLSKSDLSIWDATRHAWRCVPGTYRMRIGQSADKDGQGGGSPLAMRCR